MRKNSEGFALIEITVVVIVLGALLLIAIPTYLNQLHHDRRIEAIEELELLVEAQRSFFADNGRFAQLDDLKREKSALDRFYSLVFESVSVSECFQKNQCFKIIAKVKNDQRNDSACNILVIDNVDRKLAFDSSGKQNNQCWEK